MNRRRLSILLAALTLSPSGAALAQRAGAEATRDAPAADAGTTPDAGHGDGAPQTHAPSAAPGAVPTADRVQIPIFLEGATPELPKGVTLSRPAEVKLRVTVSTDGRISDATVMRSAGSALDEAAIRAVMSWRFRPALFDGQPIEVQSDIPLVFMPPTQDQTGGVRVVTQDGPDGGVALPGGADGGVEDPSDHPDDGDHVHVHEGHVHDHDDRHAHPHLLIGAREDAEGADAGAEGADAGRPPSRETVVRAAALAPPAVAASDFQINVGQLADVPRRSASELMTLAPGVMLTNHGGQGHADSIFLRGFAAGEGKDVELKLDGIPLNDVSNAHAHGYTQTYFIIPELVQALRVVEGPFDPSQGDFAVAGTIEYQLGLERRGITLSGSYGNFASSRAALLWGPQHAGRETFVGALFRNGAGFGLNRAYTNGTVTAQTRFELPANAHLTVMGTFYAGRFGTAGVIREGDLVTGQLPCGPGEDSQFFCSYDPDQGGAEQRLLASARLEQRFDDGGRLKTQLSVVNRSMRLRSNYTGFTYDLPPPGTAQRGDLTEQSYAGTTVSLEGTYQPQLTLWNHPRALELGYRARMDGVDTSSRRLRDRGGAPYATLFDNHIEATNLSAWARVSLRPVHRLVLRAGLRFETFLFGVLDRNAPTEDRQGTRLGEEQLEAYGFFPAPRASAEWLLTDHWSLLAAGGLGARSSDAAALSEGEFAPFAQVTAAEFGTRYARNFRRVGLEARGGGFGTRVSQDLVFDEQLGRNLPVGASTRLGVFASGRISLDQALDLQASTAYTYSALADGSDGGLLGGEALPYVPRLVARADGSWRGGFEALSQDFGWAVSLGASFIGPRPLPLGRYAEPVFLVDAGARLTWKSLELGLEAQNLLDTRWREAEYNYVSNFRGAEAAPSLLATRHFSAGAPRQLRVTLTLHFE